MHLPTLSPVEALARLGLALVLGALVGLERERGDQAAGLRTNALVCLGSALIMLVSAYGLEDVVRSSGIRLDPTRIAAQVVSGIGFLGAGTIILRREVEAVRGLTTAAGLWVVAGIGLAAGAGMYLYAVAGTIGALIILALLKPVETRFFGRQRLVLRVHPREGQLAAIRDAFQVNGIGLRRMVLQTDRLDNEETVRLEYTPAPAARVERLIEMLRAIPGLAAIESAVIWPLGAEAEDEHGDSAESAR